jgi:hypothetical protein
MCARGGDGVDCVGGEVGAEVESLGSRISLCLLCLAGVTREEWEGTYKYQRKRLAREEMMRFEQQFPRALLQTLTQRVPSTCILHNALVDDGDDRSDQRARGAGSKRIAAHAEAQLVCVPLRLCRRWRCRVLRLRFLQHNRVIANGDGSLASFLIFPHC